MMRQVQLVLTVMMRLVLLVFDHNVVAVLSAVLVQNQRVLSQHNVGAAVSAGLDHCHIQSAQQH